MNGTPFEDYRWVAWPGSILRAVSLEGSRHWRREEAMETFQISTSTERSAFACDDAHTQRRLAIKPPPDGIELVMASSVDAIETLGPIKGDEQDVQIGKGDTSGSGGRRWTLKVRWRHDQDQQAKQREDGKEQGRHKLRRRRWSI